MNGKKGSKKYVFAASSQPEFQNWFEALEKNGAVVNTGISSEASSPRSSFAASPRASSMPSVSSTISSNTPSNSTRVFFDEATESSSDFVAVDTIPTSFTSNSPKSIELTTSSNNTSITSMTTQQSNVTPVSIDQTTKLHVSAPAHSIIPVQKLPPPPLKFGILEKKSPSRFSGWQKRYFVIKESGVILYYATVSLDDIVNLNH